jgi:hypothetical protein
MFEPKTRDIWKDMAIRGGFLFLVILCCSLPITAKERADIIVAKDGSGDFTTIQAAIDAVPKNNDALKIIFGASNPPQFVKAVAEPHFIIHFRELFQFRERLIFQSFCHNYFAA